MQTLLPGSVALAYLLLLFAIAYKADRRAAQGRSPLANPYVYSLSLAVYCTSWTFFGSVGQAAQRGVNFLTIYIGPTLVFALAPIVLAKMVRIGKSQRITSIADFISARYGKSQSVGALVTVISIVGLTPYIALQLKAVSDTYQTLTGSAGEAPAAVPLMYDTGLWVAVILAAFSILFGARHIDASEHHEGMVTAIAFESIFKLIAFLVVGGAVTYVFNDGLADIFTRAATNADLARIYTIGGADEYGNWILLTLLAGIAVLCLPRQFQVAVVENVDERHILKAAWLFPLYLILINIFVLPIALAGRVAFAGTGVGPDSYMLALPLANGSPVLAMIAFLGGLSAATGMVIVETVALSIMFSNYIVMPVVVRVLSAASSSQTNLSGMVLAVRRLAMIGCIFLGYIYARLTGDSFTLVGIGLVSFAAVAQFAPAMLGGMFWRTGTKAGAVAGLSAGFLVWLYTLLLPPLAPSFVESGPFGIEMLKPYALFGLSGLGAVPQAMIWSMMANCGAFILVSLLTHQAPIERIQAALFVDAFSTSSGGASQFWRGSATVTDLRALARRFVGTARANRAFARFTATRGIDPESDAATPELVGFTERLLAGAIGTATAKVVVASVAKGDIVNLNEVMEILDENSQVIAYSHKLEAKSRELETATAELRAAYEKLTELHRLKDEFIATVTHELRTPLTSIRSFSEILHDNPDIDATQRQEFLGIVIKESERLTRLINQVLDLAKLEAGKIEWDVREVDVGQVVRDVAQSVGQLFRDKGVALEVEVPPGPVILATDRDRFGQVVLNLLSNAVKFCEPRTGRVIVNLKGDDEQIMVAVADNGPGIPESKHHAIFEKFQQVGDTMTAKPAGTGLGLTISRNIVTHLGGRIWVESEPDQGAVFSFTLPRWRVHDGDVAHEG
jgi:Na+/proline symporter/nitrogen-specific signal transduction histidine kinase